MWKRNDGTDEVNAVQNRFTAYLVTAIRRRKVQYFQWSEKWTTHETSVDPQEYVELWHEEPDMLAALPPMAQMENQRLLQALSEMPQRDRYILLAKILEDRTFGELSEELGVGYKGIAAAYYRAAQKIKRKLGGEDR